MLHGHGKQLVHKDLVWYHPGNSRLPVVLVFHLFPGHKGDGIPRIARIGRSAHHGAGRHFTEPHGFPAIPAFFLPVPPHHRDLAFLRCVPVLIGVLVRLYCIRVAAVLPRGPPHLLQQPPEIQQDIRLALHVSALRVAEMHVRVLDDLRLNVSGRGREAEGFRCARRALHVVLRVEIEVHAAVPVHGGIAYHLARLAFEPAPLHDLVELYAQHIQHGLHGAAFIEIRNRYADIVAHHRRNKELHHPAQHVHHGMVQIRRVHAAPLVSDIEILVLLHGLVKLDRVVEVLRPCKLLPNTLRRHFLPHHSSPRAVWSLPS